MSTEEEREEGKLGMATGGVGVTSPETISEEEKKLIDLFRTMRMDPGLGKSPEELTKLLTDIEERLHEKKEAKPLLIPPEVKPIVTLPGTYLSTSLGANVTETTPSTRDRTDISGTPPVTTAVHSKHGGYYQFPKLSFFYGEENKGDVTWTTLKFEIESLISEGVFSEEQILLGIRRSVKGTASDIVRRLGTGVTPREIIKKLDSTYGNIESKESIMRKFYSCTQGSDPVNIYASKLEEIYSQAITLGAISRGSDEILKQVLYQGLNVELKHIAQYKNDIITDYDRFKIELRKLESEMKSPDTDKKQTKTCHVAQKTQQEEEKSELKELKEIVQQLHNKIDQLQKEKSEHQNEFSPPTYGTGRKFYRSSNSPFRMNRGQRRGDYQRRFRRPLGSTTFRGACHRCLERGHMAKDCTKDLNKDKDLKE